MTASRSHFAKLSEFGALEVKGAQFGPVLVHITRTRSAFAPTHARPVIGADTGRLRYFRLHETPTGRGVATRGVQNDGWTSLR